MIMDNLRSLDMQQQAVVVCADAIAAIGQASGAVSERAPYDLVFADPPYAMEISEPLLLRIDTPRLLAGDGLLVVEHTLRADWPVRLGGLEQIRQERYGDSRISFYHSAVEG